MLTSPLQVVAKQEAAISQRLGQSLIVTGFIGLQSAKWILRTVQAGFYGTVQYSNK